MKNFLKSLIVLASLLTSVGASQAACWQWTKTAGPNATADPSINWAEGMSPSSVNDSARAMMARLAECRDDLSGFNVTSGGPVAYTVSTNQGLKTPIPTDTQSIAFRLNVTNGVAPTLAADGGTAYPIQTSPGVAVGSGVLVAGTPYRVTFDLASLAWVLQDFYNSTVAPGSIVTSMLADNAVTYRKMQKPSTTQRVLGTPSLAAKTITGAANNGSGLIRLTMADTTGLTTGIIKTVSGVVGTVEANGTWTLTVINSTTVDLQGSTFANNYISGGTLGGAVEEISLGTGLSMNGNVMNAAPAPAGSFKALTIKVTSNTTAAVVADYVTTINGSGGFQTTALNCTLNMASTGINGLDVGSISTSQWYYVWAMVKDDGTTGCTASLQSTANATFLSNRPAGYTYYARIGALRTAAGSAQLKGTWQYGRRVVYVVGLAQTTTSQVISSGIAGTFSNTSPDLVPVSVAGLVPPTASVIYIKTATQYQSAGITNMFVAPSMSYSGTNNGPLGSNGLVYNFYSLANQTGATFPLVLEGTSIAWQSNGPGGVMACDGWDDNI